MALLKKLKASTLMETLVATVIIMVIFMLTSMILNNLFINSVKNDNKTLNTKLNKLEYEYINKKLQLPYYEDFKQWTIHVSEAKNEATITATTSDKTVATTISNNEN